MKEKAQAIVDAILADHNGRKGLRHEWDNIDEEIQEEIRQEWIAITESLLSSPWLPIADAPKDGTRVLAACSDSPAVVYWREGWGWVSHPGKYGMNATHFQHLPEPPKEGR